MILAKSNIVSFDIEYRCDTQCLHATWQPVNPKGYIDLISFKQRTSGKIILAIRNVMRLNSSKKEVRAK